MLWVGFQMGDYCGSYNQHRLEIPFKASFVFDYDDETDDINDLVESIKMRFNKFLKAEYKGTIFDWAKETFSKVDLFPYHFYVNSQIFYSMVKNFQNHFISELLATEN